MTSTSADNSQHTVTGVTPTVTKTAESAPVPETAMGDSTDTRAASVARRPVLREPELDVPQAQEIESDSAELPDVAGGVPDNIRSQGFVPFYRKLRTVWWFEHKPWSYAHLFLWLLLDANYNPAIREYGGTIITVPRGAVLTSVLSMSKKSGLKRSTVQKFIKKMTEAGEIKTIQSGQQGVVLQVVKYEEYAGYDNARGNGRYNGRATQGATRGTTPTTHLNKENNDNN